MILLIPYEVRTLYQRNPWGNLAILGVTIVAFVLSWTNILPDEIVDSMVLEDASPAGLFGHLFLHAGWMHLIGNMVFLFVFGNAVCGVMNSILYVSVYLALGVAAGGIHLLASGMPVVGASGAISGIIGLYLAIYPINRVNCFWFFMIRGGSVELPGWLLICFWFLLDLIGAWRGTGMVAYWAHIGGTVVGFLTGLLLLKLGRVDIFDYDNPTVLHWFGFGQRVAEE
jgi:membrane associated rhomboid family serine protease